MDYGKPYVIRNKFNVSFILLVYLVGGGYMTLSYLGYIVKGEEVATTSFVFYFDFIVIISPILHMMILGAYINEHFRIHKGLLQE
jgi:hypothetical protein